MKLTDFQYNLTEEKIAKYPPKTRGNAKLLVLEKNTGKIHHKKYSEITKYLNPGDLLVLNDTKVIKARMKVTRENQKTTEIIVLEKHSVQNNRVLYFGKLNDGEILTIGTDQIKVKKTFGNGQAEIESEISLFHLAEKYGEVPIPPYLNRDSEKLDETRYQTSFANKQGSIAAPTASLNFTDELKSELEDKGVKVMYLTLHVGLGTFQPIWVDDLAEHKMHEEYYEIPKNLVKEIIQTKANNNKVIALGTTVTRALEHAAEVILSGSVVSSVELAEVRNRTNKNNQNHEFAEITAEADIFIYPGYEFKLVDKIITNFHAPESTVLMLAAAFAGWDNLKKAYKSALENEYRFLSYGDSMIVV